MEILHPIMENQVEKQMETEMEHEPETTENLK